VVTTMPRWWWPACCRVYLRVAEARAEAHETEKVATRATCEGKRRGAGRWWQWVESEVVAVLWGGGEGGAGGAAGGERKESGAVGERGESTGGC